MHGDIKYSLRQQEVKKMDKNMSTKKLVGSWHLWIMVAIVVLAIVFGNNAGIPILFPLALVLICPIMMLFMMGSKGHKH